MIETLEKFEGQNPAYRHVAFLNEMETERTIKNVFRCPYCGLVSKIIWVHGHGQCDNCKINVDECCRGEDAACRIDIQASTNG